MKWLGKKISSTPLIQPEHPLENLLECYNTEEEHDYSSDVTTRAKYIDTSTVNFDMLYNNECISLRNEEYNSMFKAESNNRKALAMCIEKEMRSMYYLITRETGGLFREQLMRMFVDNERKYMRADLYTLDKSMTLEELYALILFELM